MKLTIYDVTGRRVRVLEDLDSQGPGQYAVVWNGRSENGDEVAAGAYFYRLTAGGEALQRKLILVP